MQPKDNPKTFFSNVESIQILLVSIAGSLFAVVWVTSWDIVINIFRPDYLKALSIFRVCLCGAGLLFTGVSGIKGIIKLGKFFIELLQIYNQLKTLKKEGKKLDDEPKND